MVADRKPFGGRFRLGSLRVRTTAIAVVVVGSALLVGGAALVVLLRDSLTDQVRTAAELRAQDVAGVLESGTAPEELAVNDEEDLVIQVVDAAGRVVASSGNVEGESAIVDVAPGRSEQARATPVDDDSSFLFVVANADAPDGRFTVIVGRSTELVTDATGLVAGLLASGIPFLVLLVGVITWRTVGRTLRPVEEIRREVDEISGSELHRRVPGGPTDDEIARLATTMNRMLDRLEASAERQRRFISDASHELRSPVSVIRQHVEVVLAHPGGTSAEELAETVLAEDLRIQRLVEDLLLLARADENTLRVNWRPMDLDDVVFEEADRLRSGSQVRVDTSAVSAGRVSGDPAQLRRVLVNLGDNAVRHARSTLRFTLREDDMVVLTVEDDGTGIDETSRTRIFERFVRLDDARARDDGGSGLGLSIVAEIVAAHGGEVVVGDSDLGGARFEVRFPRVADG